MNRNQVITTRNLIRALRQLAFPMGKVPCAELRGIEQRLDQIAMDRYALASQRAEAAQLGQQIADYLASN